MQISQGKLVSRVMSQTSNVNMMSKASNNLLQAMEYKYLNKISTADYTF